MLKVILEYVQNHTNQAIYEQLLDHVEFYIIVHDDDVQRNYEHILQHDNDLMLYFRTKIN
jgi:nitrogen regulatory protein PII